MWHDGRRWKRDSGSGGGRKAAVVDGRDGGGKKEECNVQAALYFQIQTPPKEADAKMKAKMRAE